MMNTTVSEDQIRSRLSRLYRSYGYLPYKVNKFEEYDLYAQYKSFLACKQILTFSDTDGRLMALKPDVTLSVIKSASDRCPVHKVFYNENVYRVPEDGDGFSEIPQTGLECIGDIGLYESAEVVMLAARSLESISSSYVLNLSHIGVVSGILNQSGIRPEDQPEFFAVLGAKNGPAMTELCRRFDMDAQAVSNLMMLTELYGPTTEVLTRLRALPLPEESLRAVEELRELDTLLEAFGLSRVHLDFSVVDDIEYYNGIVFTGFIEGLSSSVLSGGKYDRLVSRMDRSGGAVGFAVYFNTLEPLWFTENEFDFDVVLVCPSEEDLPLAIREADRHIAAGETVRVQCSEPKGFTYRTRYTVRNGAVES